ncbi:MAG: 23S rRNA (adenine(2503)-C(2))-methyltransferase RlmN [Acidobacteriota bacterium]|jgi:23S rRNA (adenine2503-C2)-methyltransferase
MTTGLKCDKISDMANLPQILGFTREELVHLFEEMGEAGYRGEQLFRSLHRRRIFDFSEMSDLPSQLRKKLSTAVSAASLKVEAKFISKDGTRRYLMHTADNYPVETVFIPTPRRDTICFSSQSGCPLKCDFCLTAKLGLMRNLSAAEIVEQIAIVLNDVYGPGEPTPHGTNLVAMGEGEPFLNFENLLKAIRILGDESGHFIVPNRITVSTAGIVPKIREFALLKKRPNLAISLSAANDALRNKLMPINRRWPLAELMSAAKEFETTLRRGEKFTFEYVLLGGVNDSYQQACELAGLLRKYNLHKVKVNLIPHNPAEQLPYHPSDPADVLKFKETLESFGFAAYVRRPRGRDIYAACGQLAAMEPAVMSVN